MPIIYKKPKVVQARVSETIKLKVALYQSKHQCSEGQVIRLALQKFLQNVTTKQAQRKGALPK